MLREIRYLEADDIVQLRTDGVYELDGEIDTLKLLAARLKEHNCHKLLIDHRQTRVVTKILDSYDRPQLYEKLWGDRTSVRSIRSAIVFSEITEDYRFLENVVRNRGWDMSIFDDYDAAREWLLG